MKYILPLVLYLMCLSVNHALFAQVTCKSVPFLINEESDVNRWEDVLAGSHQRKLKYGDIIQISLFTSAQPSLGGTGTALFAPAPLTMDIPIRHIGPIGGLKDYEKSLLFSFLATNAADSNIFDRIIKSREGNSKLRRLWNYIMDNLFLRWDAETKSLKITVDLTNYTHDFAATFNDVSSTANLVLNNYPLNSIKRLFSDTTFLAGNNSVFYDGAAGGGNNLYYSIYSFSVMINGAYVSDWRESRELRQWSAYDWIYSGILGIPSASGNEDQPRDRIDRIAALTQKIKFRSCKYFSRYWIVPDDHKRSHLQLSDPTRNGIFGTDTFFGHVLESDLKSLYPPFVKKVIIRNGNHGHRVRICF